MAICSGQSQWEKAKRKGRCQYHACCEGHTHYCDCLFHGGVPFLVVLRLSGQGEDFRDRHHVLEALRQYCDMGHSYQSANKYSALGRSSARTLGSRAELAIRRAWRSFAHPHKTRQRYCGSVQKRAPHAVRSGAVGQTWRLHLQTKSTLSQAQIARCDRHHILAVASYPWRCSTNWTPSASLVFGE